MRLTVVRSVLFIGLMILSYSSNVYSQLNSNSDFSFAAGGGMIYYNGDLHDNSFFLPEGGLINACYNFDVTVLLIDRLELSLGYMHGKIEGDDQLSVNKYNKRRNLTFFSPVDEISLNTRIKLASELSETDVNPYLMIGFSYFWFKPQADLNGETYELQPLGTEGQFIEGSGNPEPYNLSTGALAVGLGIQINLHKNFALRLEAAPRITFTDYLDDASTNYPDSAALASTPNGAIATQLSSRDERGFPEERINRGNSGKNDVYITCGLSVVFKPNTGKRKLNPKPGLLNRDIRGKKGWRK